MAPSRKRNRAKKATRRKRCQKNHRQSSTTSAPVLKKTTVYNHVMNEKSIPTNTRLTRNQRNSIKNAVDSLSARTLRMIKRNENAPKPSIETVNPSSTSKSTNLHDSEGKSSTSEDVRNTSDDLLKNKEKETNTSEIRTRTRRIASRDAMVAIGKIAAFERELTKRKQNMDSQLVTNNNTNINQHIYPNKNANEVTTNTEKNTSVETKTNTNIDMYVDEDVDTVTDTSTNMNSNTNTNAKSIRSLATNDIIVPTLPEIVGGQSTLLLNNDNVSLMDISYGSMNGEEPSLFIDPNFDSNETPTYTSTNSSQNVSKKRTYTRAKDVPTNGGKISNLNQLVDSFKLPKTIKTSLPTELERKTEANITETNQRGGLGMLNLLQMCTNQMIDIVCPGTSRPVLQR